MKTKRLFTLALAIIMLFSALPISVSAEDEVIPISECMGQLKSGNTYSISNAEEFLIFENNNTDIYSSVKIILMNDITVNEGKFTLDESKNLLYNGKAINETNMPVSFKPIGSFGATFDGQGYTISGLYCNAESAGLFEESSRATIKNLNIKNSAFVSSESVAGTFSGQCSSATIENCTSDAIVIGRVFVGGITGSSGTIDSCLFSGTVIGEVCVGGISGGGSNIKNSGNVGTVYGDSVVGGVVGHFTDSAENSFNKGDVHGQSTVGGFAGEFYGYAESCFNTGDVYGGTSTGGFVGAIRIQQYANSLSGSTSYYLNNCYTTGSVSGRDSGKFLGATASDFSVFWCCYFVGEETDTAGPDGSIEESYQDYLDSVEPDPFGMGVIVMDIGIRPISEENLQSQDSWRFPFVLSNYITDVCNENDGYPLPKTLHKKHVWGEYVLNETDGTETAKCISDGCKATDTKKSGLNLNLWAQTNSDGSTLRFITCVDSLRYREIGFIITLADNPEQTVTRNSKVVYSSIIAGGKKLTAYDITGNENMKYILTFKITGLDGHQNTRFTVKPYTIGFDSTVAYGEAKTFCTADMI